MAATIQIYSDSNAIAAAAAELIIAGAETAVKSRGRFSMALSGGSTPRALYSLLATPPNAEKIDWAKTDLFWGDERCVPSDHPDSDYRMARESLLDSLSDPSGPHIHRMEGEIAPEIAASSYETELRAFFGSHPTHTFDILLLGMGDDGHTASLFPLTAPIHEKEHWVVGHYVSKLSSWRLTLTPPILNLARTTIFLVSGKSKAPALEQVLHGEPNPDLYPSQIIQPTHGSLLWLIDTEAAQGLQNP